MSGPFKLAALDTLQSLLGGSIFTSFPPTQVTAALSDIVEAVIKCKFQQTEPVSDDVVYQSLIETMHLIVTGRYCRFLTEDAIWAVIQRCLDNVFARGPHCSSRALLVQLSEKTIMATVQCVFSAERAKAWGVTKADTAAGAEAAAESEVPVRESPRSGSINSSSVDATTKPRVTVPFGLQCAVGVMEYFVSIIGRHAGVVTSVCFEPGVVPGASATTATAKAAEGKKGAGSAVSPTGRAGVISAGLSIGYIGLNDPSSLPSDPSSGAGADKAANSSVVEVLVALKAVQAMIRVDGSVGVLQELCALSPALVWLLRDDLGKCLVLLAGKRGFPTVVLQHTLSAFSALQVAVGPTLRVLTETFMTHVYMKALHQLLCCLVEHDGGRGVYGGKLSEDELVLTVETLHVPVAYGADTGVGAGAGAAGGKSAHSTPVKGGGADAGSGLNPAFAAAMVFTHDELAVILDHLSDLLSSVNGLIPSMYSSFDCDPLKTDLCRPLVVYLAQCARFSLLNNAYLSEHAAPGGGEQERYLAERQAEGRLNASGRFSLKQLHGLSTSCRHSVGEVLNKLVLNIPSAEADTDDLALAASSQSRMVAAAGLRVATSPGSPGEVPPALVANYLHSCRESKVLLAEATRLFVDKPKLAFKLLQSSGAAATPLSPQYVARFLRAINNVKDEIGAYIGELGKTDGKELCDSVEFREAVRTEYVNTFHFDGQDLLSCFRIFLSAFRLPGEAQQIDRILVAFSEKCHAGCSEGRSGLLENAEITYLLTFSIIMLNTDCHNPNVRADRKMTVEQFVRNNSNYGKDLNQTRPIPREFLEAIYASIYECPLRTERTDISGELTVDMWMDYQLQSEQVLERGMMVTTFAGPRRVLGLLNSVSRGVALRHGGDDNEATPSHSAPVSAESFPCKGAADVVLRMLTHGAQMVDPVAISEAVHAQHAFVDKEILQCVWLQLVGLGLSPFLSHLIVIPEVLTDSTEHSAGDDKCGAEGSNIVKLDFPVAEQYEHNTVSSHSLRKAVDIFTSMIELSHAHELPNQVDIIITLLADLAGGFLHGKLVDSFVIKYSGELGYSLLSSLQHEYFTNKRRYYATLMPTNPTAPPLSQSLAQRRHSTGDLAGLPASSSRTSSPAPGAALSSSTKGVGKAKSASPGPPQAPSTEEWIHDEFLTDIGVQQRRREIFVNMITESIRARAALGTLLQLVVASPRYVRSSSWVVVWYLLGSLRDCGLLPRDMVLADTDTEDAFPAKCRLEFEAQLKIEALKRERALIRGDERFRSKVALAKQQEEKRLAHLQKLEAKRQLAKEQGPSILSLQGWGEILFGAAGPNDAGGEGVNTHSPPVTVTEDMVLGEWLRFGDAMHHSIIAGRWDSGYEMDGGDSATQLDPVGAAAPARSSTEPGGAAITGHGSADKLADRAALPTGRKTLPVTASVSTGGASSLSSVPELVKVCGTSQLVANSRYFSDEVLLSFVTSILAISEISPLQLHSKDHYNHALTFNESTALMKFLCGQYSLTGVLIDKQSLLPAEGTNFNTFENSNMGVVDDPKKYDGIVSDISGKMAPLDVQLQAILLHVLVKDKTIGKPSSNSVAWLEILVSEIALRNRDRIGAKLWPLLASHYRRTIGTNALTLDYALERRVMGVFRIATRMLARDDHLRDEIMSLLDDLFVHAVSKKRSASVDLGTGASAGTGSGTATHVGACCLYEALSPQIACCMWRFLTANVAILPLLSLRQWQTIFDIIAHTAATTDFAAMKSFEVGNIPCRCSALCTLCSVLYCVFAYFSPFLRAIVSL